MDYFFGGIKKKAIEREESERKRGDKIFLSFFPERDS